MNNKNQSKTVRGLRNVIAERDDSIEHYKLAIDSIVDEHNTRQAALEGEKHSIALVVSLVINMVLAIFLIPSVTT